eukprot:12610031-Alexandrium_andersonii.AAC.1
MAETSTRWPFTACSYPGTPVLLVLLLLRLGLARHERWSRQPKWHFQCWACLLYTSPSPRD